MPATNAVSERSASGVRRLKTYLRSTMFQVRLNKLLVLHVHKYRTEELQLETCLNGFVFGSEHRTHLFGKFWVCLFQVDSVYTMYACWKSYMGFIYAWQNDGFHICMAERWVSYMHGWTMLNVYEVAVVPAGFSTTGIEKAGFRDLGLGLVIRKFICPTLIPAGPLATAKCIHPFIELN